MHDDRVVIWGMSCAGKTTLARGMVGHAYHCFDALFPWADIEGLGLSTDAALIHIRGRCLESKFVLDGWHLADPEGRLMPEACVYVLYADYETIIGQYRVPVSDPEVHRPMFRKWYDRDFGFPRTRYFWNDGSSFQERNVSDFTSFQKHNR